MDIWPQGVLGLRNRTASIVLRWSQVATYTFRAISLTSFLCMLILSPSHFFFNTLESWISLPVKVRKDQRRAGQVWDGKSSSLSGVLEMSKKNQQSRRKKQIQMGKWEALQVNQWIHQFLLDEELCSWALPFTTLWHDELVRSRAIGMLIPGPGSASCFHLLLSPILFMDK